MYKSLGFAPGVILAAAPAAGPAAPIVAGIALVGSALSALFSFGSDVPYDDFDREIRPTLLENAQRTGLPTFAAWYGEVIGVDSNNKFYKLGTFSTLDEAERILQKAANAVGQIYALWHGIMRVFNPGATSAEPATTTGTIPPTDFGGTVLAAVSNYWPWLLLGGAGLYLYMRKR